MGLVDFIKNLANKEVQDYPIIPLVQANEQGGLETDPLKMAQAQLAQKQASTPRTLGDRLFGREMTQDYQTVNPDTNETEMTTISNYRPGFFNDLASGYRENATQGFDVNNLAPQRKGLATRIGEGLGTLARFYDKPIGRMAVATGLSMLTDEANPLGEGVKAYVGRQTNMTRDKAYRQSLINMGVNADQVNSIPGIMTDDIYKNLIDAKQAQEMQKYREMYLDTQNKNQEGLNKYRMAQIAEEIKQNQLDNYFKKRELNIKEQEAKKGGFPTTITAVRKEFSSIPAIKNANEIKRQFDNVTNTYNAYKQGKLRANAADQAMVTTLNKILDPTSVVRESEFARTAAGQSFFARAQGYADKITKGGGGLTNAEREDLYNAMQEMYNANQAEMQEYVKSYTDLAERYGVNPADIMPRQYSSSENNANYSQTGGYKEGQTATNPTTGAKIIFRGGKWQTL